MNGEIPSPNAIAIIGQACRFPGANCPEKFWELMMEKVDATNDVPMDRHCGEKIKTHIKRGGFLKCPVDEFDADFFGISASEARVLDPRQRFLLEVAWESLEDAGICPETLRGSKTNVNVGLWSPDYDKILHEFRVDGGDLLGAEAGYLSAAHGVSAARLSHFLGLHGHHESSDAGCSSSLISLHESCDSLQRKNCDLAIAAGVNLILTSSMTKSGSLVLAPNGRCKTFDAGADGYARAEGVGVLILKRLSDALKDKDRIHAVIRGVGINADSTSLTFGTPDRNGQVKAIEEALRISELSPEEIGFAEAHGTGVLVGDTVEIEALATVYQRNREKSNPLFISSVKGNIGHCEAAAGMAAIIKVILAMKYEKIPPQFPYNKINPEVEKQLNIIPGKIPLDAIPWEKKQGKKRLAGISAFALGGENAHVILEEPPVVNCYGEKENDDENWHVLTVSAKCVKSLEEKVESYKKFFKLNEQQLNFKDLVFTANCCRSHFDKRHAVVGKNISDVIIGLNLDNWKTLKKPDDESKSVVFILVSKLNFNMSAARSMYRKYSVFEQNFNICSAIVANNLNVSLKNILFENVVNKDCAIGEVMNFTVNYSWTKVLESFGVRANFVVGSATILSEVLGGTISGILLVADAVSIILGIRDKIAHSSIVKDKNDLNGKFISGFTGNIVEDFDPAFCMNDKIIGRGEVNEKIISYLRAKKCNIFINVGGISEEYTNFATNTEVESSELWLEFKNCENGDKKYFWKGLCANLSELYIRGVPINWQNFQVHSGQSRNKIQLPTYPFQRKSFWVGKLNNDQ